MTVATFDTGRGLALVCTLALHLSVALPARGQSDAARGDSARSAHGPGSKHSRAPADAGPVGPPDARLPTITLEALLKRANQDPPTVLRARASFRSAQADLDYAQGQWFPALLANGSYGYAYDNRVVLPGVPRIDSESLEARGSVGLEWSVIDGARGARIDQAKASLRAASHTLRSTRQLAMLAAAELFFEARAAREFVLDAQLSLSRRSQQYKATVELVEAGTRSPVDAQRAEIEVTSTQYALELRQSEEHAVLAALAAAIGRGPTELVRPAAGARVAPSEATSPSAARALAQAQHPEVSMMEARLATAREAHDVALAERAPTVGVSASASMSYLDVRRGAGISGHQFGAVVSAFVRFAGFDPAVWMKADATGPKVAEAERARAELFHRVGAEAVRAYYAVERARIEQRRAEAMLESAHKARAAQKGRYLAGMSSLLELLDAEDLEQRARSRRIAAKRDAAISVMRLLAACGQLQDAG